MNVPYPTNTKLQQSSTQLHNTADTRVFKTITSSNGLCHHTSQNVSLFCHRLNSYVCVTIFRKQPIQPKIPSHQCHDNV